MRSSLSFASARALSRAPICLIVIIVALGVAITGPAQTSTNSPSPTPAPNPTATRVDQLIAECRQLLAKGSFEEVAPKAYEAVSLSQSIGDKIRQSRSLMYVALGRFHGGHLEESIEPFKQSAALAGEGGDPRLQALALRSAAVLLVDVGQFDDALFFYNEALTLQRTLKNRAAEASLLGNIGRIYAAMRDYAKAERLLRESLNIAVDLHDELVQFSALAKLANMEIGRSNYDQALKYSAEALQLRSTEIDAAMRNELLHDIAIAHFEAGNNQEAADVLEQVVAFERKGKIASAEGAARASLAQVQLRMGKTDQALASAGDALTMLRRSGADPSVQAGVLYTQALAQRKLGRNEEALTSLRAAISLIERARLLTVSTERARAEFFSGKSAVYVAAIELLSALRRDDEALAVAESYHGRAFLDSLAESRADLRKAVPREFLVSEDAMLGRISEIQKQLWQENIPPSTEQKLKQELADAESALEQFLLEAHHTNPQYASLKHFRPLSPARVQQELLDSETVLIEYVLGSEESYAWLVSKEGVVAAKLPPEKDLNGLIGEYRKALLERPGGTVEAQSAARLNSLSERLYAALIAPFQDRLNARQRLLIVPDKSLAYLPFETLLSRKTVGSSRTEYLVERFAITYAPSASALAEVREMRSRPQPQALVAFADPLYEAAGAQVRSTASPAKNDLSERGLDLRPLPYTRTEANNIGALFPVAQRKIFLGAEASEQNVKSAALADYRYLHFATHGVVDEDVPSRSGVILSLVGNDKEDGILQMPEIMRLKLNADLVTLSACRTGLGEVVGGEGVLGLTRAFMYAGARSVVASLWNVNDTATAELMKSFYANLKKGQSKDEALRQAKLGLLHGRQVSWRNPYYWAPFVLAGANN